MKILVTGAAGFIGFHTCLRLLQAGHEVIGLDILNDYYDVKLKEDRLKALGITGDPHSAVKQPLHSREYPSFMFQKINLADKEALAAVFGEYKFSAVCHLAAQAGVRYSLEKPEAYLESNITGQVNMLEACRKYPVRHFVYASSSSVYGLNGKQPFSVHHGTSHPISIYAASKIFDELVSHTYSHLFSIPCTGLRFFTVYGPWGRPDMAIFKFTRAILEGNPIDIYNQGEMARDFTYVDDIVAGICAVLEKPPIANAYWDSTLADPAASSAAHRIYNLGYGSPVRLMDFIEAIEICTGKQAKKNYLPLQPGDVVNTWADSSEFQKDFDIIPSTSVREGVQRFVDWYRRYYSV